MPRYNATVENPRVSKIFGMPKQTISDWTKSGNWREELLDKLRMQIALMDDTETLLKNLFTQNEIKAIGESLINDTVNEDTIMNSEHMIFSFQRYCEQNYEQASQYGNVKHLSQSVVDKLSKTTAWQRYCLVELITQELS